MRRSALVCLLLLACSSNDPKTGDANVDDATGGGDDGGSGSGDDGGGDDGGDDDEDTGDTGDTGDNDAWRDDERLSEPDELAPDLIALVAPNWGGDLAVDGDAITILGTAAPETVALVWASETANGELRPTDAWTAADLPLEAGDNTFVFTATDGDGRTETETLRVTSTPGIPLASGLSLSLEQVDVASTVTVSAGVHTSGPVDQIEVGPDDGAGGLTEVWGTLADDDGDGRWAADLAIPADAAASYTLRALATVAEVSGTTPPVDFSVATPLSDSELDALETTMALVDAATEAAEDSALARAEAAAAALLAIPEVEAVLLDPSGRTVEYVQSGLPHVVYEPLPGEAGAAEEDISELPSGELPAAAPPPRAPTMQTARHLQARTWSSAGAAGPPPPPPSTATDNNEIITIAPFSDHFQGRYDADGDGIVDRVFPLELGEFLPALVDEREIECPALGTVTRYGITDPTEADLSAVRDGLNAGIFSLSTHGMVSRSYGPSGWGAERGILATRQGPSRRDLSADDQAHFNAGNLVRVKAHGEWVLAFTGPWVRAERPADFPLQNTVVGLTACNSGTTVEPIASFLASGASAAYGFEGSVSAVSALQADVAFMRGFIEREEANTQLAAVAEHFPPRDGGRLVWQAEDDVYLGNTTGLQNGGFEQVTAPSADPDHWTTVSALGTDFDAFVVTEYLSTVPEEGSNLMYMFTYDGDPSYNEIGQDICPAPGRLMHLSFKWQVRTNESASCGASSVPNWVNVRMQGDDFDATVLWHVDWSDVCPLLTDTGEYSQKSTGWLEAEVFFEAPETVLPDDERIVFTVGGYNTSIWLGFFDDVQLVPVD